MNRHQRGERQSRRDFFRRSAAASLGLTGVANAISQLRLVTAMQAAEGAPAGDYKALVCIFLSGGNDSNNLLVPRSGPLRTEYENARGVLALPVADPDPTRNIIQISPDNEARDFGVHPNCPRIAQLFDAGKLGFICNIGTLAYPIATRDDYINGVVPRPDQLFSHSDQISEWQSSIADQGFTSGWGGRVADLLNVCNPDSKVSMSISLNGLNRFQVGASGTVEQYSVSPSGAAIALDGYGSGYGDALDASGAYRNTDAGRRLQAFETVMNLSQENLLQESYNGILRSARANEGFVGSAFAAADASGVDFDAIFSGAGGQLGDQLKTVARLIAGRVELGNTRQVFFCQAGGYDTHQGMLQAHAGLMAELDSALKAFHDATVALGVENDVTSFTASDFNRTLTPNGDDIVTAGSDHAWGGHSMVLGGAVKGKKLYGHFMDQLVPGSGRDANLDRGRWIPTTAVDQKFAVLAEWFGIAPGDLPAVFPNLPRFAAPSDPAANLDFIDFVV